MRLHIALAEATHSAPLVLAMTEAQSRMGDLIALIAHPAPVLASSNAQHRRLVEALRERDGRRAMLEMTDHVRGTEHVLAGMLPGCRCRRTRKMDKFLTHRIWSSVL